ncbi:hypothetical protein LCGC14_1396620 [marine sediment metagenome]|uniref:Uncharacterized protein n=1 Tax=marine sediment metagenome TaxID=412755 RepID=A0A0F9JYG3_9ZZZZ
MKMSITTGPPFRELATATIPSFWIELHPTYRMDPSFWIEVERRASGVDRNDVPAMRKLIAEVEHDMPADA